MNRHAMLMMAGFLGLAAVLAQAQGDPEKAKAAEQLNERQIDERKRELDDNLAKRIAGIEKRFAESQSFQVQIKDDRIAFEKKMAEDKKVFLDSLKTMKPDERKKAWQDFDQAHRQRNEEFRKIQETKRQEFRRVHKEEKVEFHKEIKKDRQGFREKQSRERREAKDPMKHSPAQGAPGSVK